MHTESVLTHACKAHWQLSLSHSLPPPTPTTTLPFLLSLSRHATPRRLLLPLFARSLSASFVRLRLASLGFGSACLLLSLSLRSLKQQALCAIAEQEKRTKALRARHTHTYIRLCLCVFECVRVCDIESENYQR